MRVAVLSVILLSSCGGGPTSPTVLPANIERVTIGRITACIGGGSARTCMFEETATNTGPGCATNIRGTVRFLSSSGTDLSAASWSLSPATRIVVVGEQFVYRATISGPESVISQIANYTEQFAWSSVQC